MRIRTCLQPANTLAARVVTAAMPWALAMVLIIGGAGGCETEPVVVRSGWDHLDPKIADAYGKRRDEIGRDADELPAVDSDASWAIATDQFVGVSHRQIAARRVDELRRATDLGEFYALEEGGRSTVYFGRYPSPQDPAAQAAMDRLRQLNARGDIRFGTLLFAPLLEPGDALDSSLAQYDLRQAQGRGVYTLQIGFYDSADDARKKMAEQAAAALRKDGELAFFFHGPNRSMVTVGLFGEDAIESHSGEGRQIRTTYSASVLALQGKYPHNLANGATIQETRAGGPATTQPSFLVRVPR